jgi:Holliday junction resolvasome RuvABC ATP-dependent DNA helicase subunit
MFNLVSFLVMIVMIIAIPISIFFIFKTTIKYVFKPLKNVEETNSDTTINTDEDNPLKVVIKDNNLDVNRIIEYQGLEIKKFEFRPEKWEQFIAQEEAKKRAITVCKKAKRGIRAHLILSAIKGHGKTTYIELLAKSIGAKLITRIGKQIDEENLVDIINEINTSKEEIVIFFIDEIDTCHWKVIKILNPIIEQFKISGKKIKPFIFAGATINKHLLIKNNPDTLDRIPHHINFERYNDIDVAKIITQYKEQLYTEENVSKEVVDIISKNCKFNPRTAIALLEDYLIEQSMEKVLKNCNIIKGGLTKVDVKILEILNNTTRAMGANALAQRVGLSQNEYMTEYEPFLVEFGYISRVPSRLITQKGKDFLGSIK